MKELSNVGISLSTSDPAGVNILRAFRELGFQNTGEPGLLKRDNLLLIVLEHLIVPTKKYIVPKFPVPYPIDFDIMAKRLSLQYLIIASKHQSDSGRPCLTVHPTGNFGKAIYGGNPRELQYTLANPMRNILIELQEDPPKGYTVTLEATHHSPTSFKVPLFFVELGSSERELTDAEAAIYLTKAIPRGIDAKRKAPVAIGFGGGHYCSTFTQMEKNYAFGHICPKYALDLLNNVLIKQMVERTLDGVEKVIFDKGLKGYQRKKLTVNLRHLDLEEMIEKI